MEEYLRLYNLYHRIFIICLAGSCIFLIISIVLFFMLKIRVIIGDLTGKTASKMVKKMEEKYRLTGKQVKVNEESATAMLVNNPKPVHNHNFIIEKQMILIHTEEMINLPLRK